MKHKIIITTLVSLFALPSFAQQIPIGSCGFVYIDDAAGNRIKRVYFCNNNTEPYPVSRISINNFIENQDTLNKVKENNTVEFQPIEKIYPNPTTGIFNIEFSSSLLNSSISIIDVNGKVIQNYTATGFKFTCNLTGFPSGVYFVIIKNNNTTISQKIIKQ
jgi:Secretion system C-terminal sorting domain